MTDIPTVIDLDGVVEPYLDGGKLITYSCKYLTKPGDNYGSILLAIEAQVLSKDGIIYLLPLVAKLPPVNNEFLWQIFQPERTCVTENAVYSHLSPAIKNLQLEAGIDDSKVYDALPKYYGSRISLDDEAKKVDENAVLVQENLQAIGFRAGNRHKMYDLQHATLIMPQVAKFHALPIALRIKKQQEFNKDIRPYFRRFGVNTALNEQAQKKIEQQLLKDIAAATENDQTVLDRMKELIEDYNKLLNSPEKEDGLYTSIVHFDMWINNFMIKYDEQNLPCEVKLIDFELAEYESLAYDVIFFIFSSLEVNVIDQHTDELLLLYYNSFIESLNSVGVSTTDYSFKSFMQEIHEYAHVAVCLCLFMIRIILADDNIMSEHFKNMDLAVLKKNANELVVQRTADVIRLAQKFHFFFKS